MKERHRLFIKEICWLLMLAFSRSLIIYILKETKGKNVFWFRIVRGIYDRAPDLDTIIESLVQVSKRASRHFSAPMELTFKPPKGLDFSALEEVEIKQVMNALSKNGVRFVVV